MKHPISAATQALLKLLTTKPTVAPVVHHAVVQHVAAKLAAVAVVGAVLVTGPGTANGKPTPGTQVAYGRTPDGYCVVTGVYDLPQGVIADEDCRPTPVPGGGFYVG